MTLTEDETKLYYDLMWPLLYYANQRLEIIPNVASVDAYQRLNSTDKLLVRDAVFNDTKLIGDYVNANPDHLSTDKLGVISNWRNCVVGDFFIERHLAKHTIFIQDKAVYAVLGLTDPLAEIVPRWSLPAYVKTVLLPFRGKIIYDGLLEGYNIIIGSGIRSSLKETYLAAKQNGLIIDSLGDAPAPESKPRRQTVDLRPRLDALLKEIQELRSTSEAPAVETAAFSVLKAAGALAHAAVHAPDDIAALRTHATKAGRALRKVDTVLDRAEW